MKSELIAKPVVTMPDRDHGFIEYEGTMLNRAVIGDVTYQDAAILMEAISTEGSAGGDGFAFERMLFEDGKMGIVFSNSAASPINPKIDQIDDAELRGPDVRKKFDSTIDWVKAPKKASIPSPYHHRRPWWHETKAASPGACHDPGARNHPDYGDSEASGLQPPDAQPADYEDWPYCDETDRQLPKDFPNDFDNRGAV